MDYGELIKKSWRMMWQHRFLWVLGLFATSTVGSCSPSGGNGPVQYQMGPGDVDRLPPEWEQGLGQIPEQLLAPNRELILTIAIGAAVLGLIAMVLSLIAQGAMARATADLAEGRESSLGPAWSTGLSLFWRYVVLWLILIGVGILVALVVAIAIGVLVAMVSFTGDAARVIFLIVAGIVGLVLVVVAVPAFIAVSVAVAFAQRAIAVENTGPLSGLESGFRLIRRNLGTSALAWLISLALSVGVGVAVTLAVVVLLIPLGGIAAVLFMSTGVTAASIIYAVLALLVFIAAVWVLAGVANSFFWSYWTLVYMRLTGRLTERLDVVTEGV